MDYLPSRSRHSLKHLLPVVLVFPPLQATTLVTTRSVLIPVPITLVILPIQSTTELATLLSQAALLAATLSKEIATLEAHAHMTQWQTLAGGKALALTRSAMSSTMSFRNTILSLHANGTKIASIATNGNSSKATALKLQLAPLLLLPHQSHAPGQKHVKLLVGGDVWMRPVVSQYP